MCIAGLNWISQACLIFLKQLQPCQFRWLGLKDLGCFHPHRSLFKCTRQKFIYCHQIQRNASLSSSTVPSCVLVGGYMSSGLMLTHSNSTVFIRWEHAPTRFKCYDWINFASIYICLRSECLSRELHWCFIACICECPYSYKGQSEVVWIVSK